jgi:predicted CopG family antitoxin
VRSSKKRRVSGLQMKRFTADLEVSVYEKLNAIAGQNSLSYTMERLIERYYDKAIKKQSAQIQESSLTIAQ